MENFKLTDSKTTGTSSNPHYVNHNTSLKVLSICNNTNSLTNFTNRNNSNIIQYSNGIVSTGDFFQTIDKDHIRFHTDLNKI